MVIREKILNYFKSNHILTINLLLSLYFIFLYYLVTISFDKNIVLSISFRLILPIYIFLSFITNILLISEKSLKFSYYIVNCITSMYVCYVQGNYISISKFDYTFTYLFKNIIVPVIIVISIFRVFIKLIVLKNQKI